MKIETKEISLGTYKITTSGENSYLQSSHTDLKHKISPLQKDYLEKINNKITIEKMVNSAIASSENFSFRELFQLLENLVDLNLVIDSDVRRYFEHADNIDSTNLQTAPIEGIETISHWKPEDLTSLPFFRNLKDETLKIFIKQCQIITVPERTLVVQNENSDRDMYVILEGEASIYRVDDLKRRRLITSIPAGSVFGEGAFFLNRPRTADVITNVKSVIAQIKYDETKFANFIHNTKTSFLQERLWILHGLLSSPLFHHIPTETMDHFLLMGKSKTIKMNEYICKQGQSGDSFFVIIQGKCNVFRNNLLIKGLKQGDIFGEVALLINQGDRIATIQAASDCLLLEITKTEFYKVLAQNLFLAKEIEEVAYKRYNNFF